MTGYSIATKVDADLYSASMEIKAASEIGFTADCAFSLLETVGS
jgi:hypothetical protein